MKSRKILSVLLAMVMVFSLFPVLAPSARAAGDVTINSTNFPDDNFRSHVSSYFDTDKNGTLSTNEIAAVTTISVYGKEITTFSDLKSVISEHSVGDTLSFELERNGRTGTLQLTLEEYSPSDAA